MSDACTEVGHGAMHALQGWTPMHCVADNLHIDVTDLLDKGSEEMLNFADSMVCLNLTAFSRGLYSEMEASEAVIE